MVMLTTHLKVEASLQTLLFAKDIAKAKTQSYICERLAAAIDSIKPCRTEAQRLEYSIILAAVMPREEDGMLDATAQELNFKYGKRRGREYAATKAMSRRKVFDAVSKKLDTETHPLRPGETVLCQGQIAQLVTLEASGKCSVLFQSAEGGLTQHVDYEWYGHRKGVRSARLQRPPPLLQALPRQVRKDVVSAEVKGQVQEVYEISCPVSPHQRDSMKRRIGPHLYQEAHALIRMQTFDELYAVFKQMNPNAKLSKSKFKRLAPWNLKKAHRETCLCRCCELFKLYLSALNDVGKLLKPLVVQQAGGDELEEETEGQSDAEERESGSSDTGNRAAASTSLERLIRMCSLEHKSALADHLVCGGCVVTAKPACVKGDCIQCGFKAFWQPVRQTLVDKNGRLLSNTTAEWQCTVRYEVLRSGGSSPSDGSAAEERETMRERKEASVIELLDEFQKISKLFPGHRQLVAATKDAATQRNRNCWIGMILSDYDWSENGVIASARQIQSEYWSLVYYSLFIQISSYLEREAWLSCSSFLPPGTMVTVQKDEDDFNADEPTEGAFYAVVQTPPLSPSEPQLYSVKVYGHSSLPDEHEIHGINRERLRHRKWRTTATIGVTDEKRHDAWTTQHFLDLQFRHWLCVLDREQFWSWVGHSDNASHFKSGAMMNYWSGKMGELDFLKTCWIEFGCPGHGKGPWDGLGAVLKQQVSRDITNNKILTESGYITCPKEVAEHLRARFSTREWREAHQHKAIHEILIFYAPHQDITRPRGGCTFDSLEGARSSFSYLMLAKDQICRRERSCWCGGCVRAKGRTTLRSFGDQLRCEECVHRDKPDWIQQTVRNLGTGLAGRRKEAQEEGKKFAQMLRAPTRAKPNDGFIALQVCNIEHTLCRVSLHEGTKD